MASGQQPLGKSSKLSRLICFLGLILMSRGERSPRPERKPGAAHQLTYTERIIDDVYQDALKTSLKTADTTSNLILTTAFSILTGYGAILALVSPKDSPAPVTVAVPPAILSAAVLLALAATTRSVELADHGDLTKVIGTVKRTRWWKRFLNVLAVVMLTLGLALAGVIIARTYRSEPKPDVNARVVLTRRGQQIVMQVCATPATVMTLNGVVKDRNERELLLQLDAETCPSGAGTLVLPRSAVEIVKEEDT